MRSRSPIRESTKIKDVARAAGSPRRPSRTSSTRRGSSARRRGGGSWPRSRSATTRRTCAQPRLRAQPHFRPDHLGRRQPVLPRVGQGHREKASAHGYDVILSNTNYDPKRTVACVQRLLEQQVRGVAIMTSRWTFRSPSGWRRSRWPSSSTSGRSGRTRQHRRQLREGRPRRRRAPARARPPPHRLHQRPRPPQVSSAAPGEPSPRR